MITALQISRYSFSHTTGSQMMKAFNAMIEGLASRSHTISWALLRILASAMFMTHGWGKIFGGRAQPIFGGMDFFGINLGINMLWIAGVIELFGGALLLLGLFTRPIALLASILMLMAYLSAHAAWFPTLNNGELATMYFLVFFSIFARGAGPISLDAKLFGKQ
jgi:putative oxidoreductase